MMSYTCDMYCIVKLQSITVKDGTNIMDVGTGGFQNPFSNTISECHIFIWLLTKETKGDKCCC
jgi:hypothetical protein